MPRAYALAVLVKVIKLGLWIGLIFLFLFSPAILQLFYADRSLNIFIWPMTLDANKIEAFARERGIDVHVSYYENGEELLHKIHMTKGKGYDLIMPPDYVVDILIEEDLVKKIDKKSLSFYQDLNPLFLNHYFDKGNEYSIPYFVSIYGLGIDTDFFGNKQPEPSWSLIFEPQEKAYKVTMTDDPRRAVMIAGRYLYGPKSELKEDQLLKIKELLLRQKNKVEMYTDIRTEELLVAKRCPVVMVISPDLVRIQREYKNIVFAIPKEGSFVTIDSFVIPKTSAKSSYVYELLNFIYSPEIIKHNSIKYGCCPALKTVSTQGFDILCPDKKLMDHLDFFKTPIAKKSIDSVWIDLMAH